MDIKKQQIKSTLSMLDYTDIVTDADKVCYDSSGTSLEATNVKDAIDELSNAENIAYGNEKLSANSVKQALDNIFDKIYPVGSIYMSMDNNFNPNAAFGGTWVKLESGKVLMSTDANAGQQGGSESENYRPEGVVSTAIFNGQKATLTGTIGGTSLDGSQIPSHSHSFSGSTGGANKDLREYIIFSNYHIGGNTYAGMVENIEKGGDGIWKALPKFSVSLHSGINASQLPRIDKPSAAGITLDVNHAHSFSGNTNPAGSGAAHNHSLSMNEYTPSGSISSQSFTGTGATISHMQPYITCYMWKRTA